MYSHQRGLLSPWSGLFRSNDSLAVQYIMCYMTIYKINEQ